MTYDIEIKKLVKTFGKEIIYDHFDFEVEKGAIVALLGPSGCGKTTLLNMIAGLEPYDHGDICMDQKPSYVFQEARLLPWLTLWENLNYVYDLEKSLKNIKRAEVLLSAVNLLEYKAYYPSQLSGGMKQRVSIVRGFLTPHEVILMDEPFKGLDSELKHQIISNLKEIIMREEKTILYVTHDLKSAQLFSTKIYEIKGRPAHLFSKK